jgi:hypothetical protein
MPTQVVLCQNRIPDQEWMDRTLTHELIHAFDHCRAKVDWNNCEHHACSEVRVQLVDDVDGSRSTPTHRPPARGWLQVRAAALSGDCNWKYEFMRKNFNIAKQHQVRFASIAAVGVSSPRLTPMAGPDLHAATRQAVHHAERGVPGQGGRVPRQGLRRVLPRRVALPRDPLSLPHSSSGRLGLGPVSAAVNAG